MHDFRQRLILSLQIYKKIFDYNMKVCKYFMAILNAEIPLKSDVCVKTNRIFLVGRAYDGADLVIFKRVPIL